MKDLFVGAQNVSRVALIKSYDNAWSHRAQPHSASFDYNRLLQDYYTALRASQVAVDVTGVETDFSPYRLILLLAFNLMTPAILEKCRTYVQDGGHLLITFRSSTRNRDNSMMELPASGYSAGLAGVTLEEYDALSRGRQVAVRGENLQGAASVWCDALSCQGAVPLASFASQCYAGAPTVTVHAVGAGCDLDTQGLKQLLGQVLTDADAAPECPAPPSGVEVVVKEKAGEALPVRVESHA